MLFGPCFAPAARGFQLQKACQAGEIDEVLDLLRAHPKLLKSRCLPGKQTIWHAAAHSGQVHVLEAIVNYVWCTQPFSPNAQYRAAISKKQQSSLVNSLGTITKQQVQPGHDTRDDPAGPAPQRRFKGDLHPIILECMAIVNQVGQTPLMTASVAGQAEAVTCLLQQASGTSAG